MLNKNTMNYHEYWQVIADKTGYDFSGYSAESMNRKLEGFISSESIGSADELSYKLYSDRIIRDKILGRLLTNYTELFRDPGFFLSVNVSVLPYLATYPKINIWHAGCATGEEVYSLAILLDELGLLNRCNIIATDINEQNLKNAATAIYPLQRMQESASRYFASGGKHNLSQYYTAYYDHVIFNSRLRDRIKFMAHNLVSQEPVDKFHLILCRNVFIYFNQNLQQKVLRSIVGSLHNYGYLGMGIQEQFVDINKKELTVIDRHNKIYRKLNDR